MAVVNLNVASQLAQALADRLSPLDALGLLMDIARGDCPHWTQEACQAADAAAAAADRYDPAGIVDALRPVIPQPLRVFLQPLAWAAANPFIDLTQGATP